MRFIALVSLVILITIGGLVACNSNETLLSQTPKPGATPAKPTPAPADDARRITAAELYELYKKDEVVIIDTRGESAYKEERIKGAISMPAGTVLGRIGELPRDKMIAAYCT